MAILVLQVGYLRITHPFATKIPRRIFPFDLHVLGTPPAFILSQDQTLHLFESVFSLFPLYFFPSASRFRVSFIDVFVCLFLPV